MDDMFGAQDRVCERVIVELCASLIEGGTIDEVRCATENAEAYQALSTAISRMFARGISDALYSIEMADRAATLYPSQRYNIMLVESALATKEVVATRIRDLGGS